MHPSQMRAACTRALPDLALLLAAERTSLARHCGPVSHPTIAHRIAESDPTCTGFVIQRRRRSSCGTRASGFGVPLSCPNAGDSWRPKERDLTLPRPPRRDYHPGEGDSLVSPSAPSPPLTQGRFTRGRGRGEPTSNSRPAALNRDTADRECLTRSGDDQEALRPFRGPAEPSPQAFSRLHQGFPPPRKPPAQPRQYAVVMNLLQHESGFEQDPPCFPQREHIGRDAAAHRVPNPVGRPERAPPIHVHVRE